MRSDKADELLKCRLAKLLEEKATRGILLLDRPKTRRFARDPLQELAIDMILHRGGLVLRSLHGREYMAVSLPECSIEHSIMLLSPGGVEAKADAVYIREHGRDWARLIDYRLSPIFIIDLSFISWHKHESELVSLRRQLSTTLGAIRKYLWDGHMVLSSTKPGIAAWLSSYLGRSLVKLTPLTPLDYLQGLDYEKIVLLDPQAEKDLEPREVLETDVFIIGGIVDKLPQPGLSRILYKLSEESVQPRRIALRGRTEGVPKTINGIVEALLLARYKYAGSIEKALIDVMAKHDIMLRLHIEILRASRGNETLDPSLYCELKTWLPITWQDFVKAVRKAGLKLKSIEQPSCRQDW
ncbi:MAG: tRNA (guanine-N1)-methyltransferase [Pyrodictiaceae archaeon]